MKLNSVVTPAQAAVIAAVTEALLAVARDEHGLDDHHARIRVHLDGANRRVLQGLVIEVIAEKRRLLRFEAQSLDPNGSCVSPMILGRTPEHPPTKAARGRIERAIHRARHQRVTEESHEPTPHDEPSTAAAAQQPTGPGRPDLDHIDASLHTIQSAAALMATSTGSENELRAGYASIQQLVRTLRGELRTAEPSDA